MTETEQRVAAIMAVLRRTRFDLSNEKACQAAIADALKDAGIAAVRERRLSAKDVLDFLVDGGIALEVKLAGQRKVAAFKQIERYARHERVKAVVLVSNLSMGLPQEIGGKPAYFVSLGRAWI